MSLSLSSSSSLPFVAASQHHGSSTYRIPLQLFHNNRMKLAYQLSLTTMSSAVGDSSSSNFYYYYVVLMGGVSPTRYDTDHEPIFRQESYFYWLTGVKEPDCAVVLKIRMMIRNNNGSSTVQDVTTTLFIPKLPPSYATIMGRIQTPNEWKDQYQVDHVKYVEELQSTIQDQILTELHNNSNNNGHNDHQHKQQQQQHKILLMKGRNSDSGLMYEPPTDFSNSSSLKRFLSLLKNEKGLDVEINDTILFPILAECRVIKSNDELRLLEHVSQVSSFAHAYVMRNVFQSSRLTTTTTTPTTTSRVQYEYQCESLFRHYCYFNYGCRLVSYTSICGCGPNSAILHYGHAGEPNSRQIQFGKNGNTSNDGNVTTTTTTAKTTVVEADHVLFDMGAEYMCYGSDITCSFPVNGQFTNKYQQVYEAVLNAQRVVISMIQPNISWVDCHKAAEIEILKGLYRIGIIVIPSNDDDDDVGKKDTISPEVLSTIQHLNDEYRFGAVFMPHGLGHFLGIDTHDVGGYLPGHPERSSLPGLKSLRTSRILQPGMVLTVEPGCYFIDHLLDEAFVHPTLSQYLNHTLINDEYRGYGGVRLEDVVTVVEPPQYNDNNDKDGEGGNGGKGGKGGNGGDTFVPGSGCINFTLCPRTVKEVEHVMAGGKWPPTKDEAPELRRVRLTTPISPLPPPPSY